MRQIRRSVFETNSSSCHSVAVAGGVEPGDLLDSLPVDNGGQVSLMPGEFGRSYDFTNDVRMKASYCSTYARNYGIEADIELLVKVICEHTGADTVLFDENTAPYSDPEGFIDHQSIDVAQSVFFDEDTLKLFIFHPRSTLRLDADG
jgi:hypothetical protein